MTLINAHGDRSGSKVRKPSPIPIPIHTATTNLSNPHEAFFLNLAVKMKLHLDDPRGDGSDRESLLRFYDAFPRVRRYSRIPVTALKRKRVPRIEKSRKKTNRVPCEVFGSLPGEEEILASDDDEQDEKKEEGNSSSCDRDRDGDGSRNASGPE